MNITKEQFEEAKIIIDQYRSQVNKEFIKSEYTCICCKKTKIYAHYPEEINPLVPGDSTWDNGIVTTIQFGYGSIHDTKSFFIGICDSCIKQLSIEGIIISYNKLLKIMSEK